jgi:hypothetical protein
LKLSSYFEIVILSAAKDLLLPLPLPLFVPVVILSEVTHASESRSRRTPKPPTPPQRPEPFSQQLQPSYRLPRTFPKCNAIITPSNKAPAPTTSHPAQPIGQKNRSSTATATRFPNPHNTLVTGDDSPTPGGFANGD